MQMITYNLRTLSCNCTNIITMASVQCLIIFNIFILFIASSAGKSISEQRVIRSVNNDYSDEVSSQGSGADDVDDECEEDITHHIICRHDGVSILVSHGDFKGQFYVDGHESDSKCMKKFSSQKTFLNISFGDCGLEKSAEVKLNVTIQAMDGELTEEPETVPMSCPYRPHSSNVSHDIPPIQPKYKSQPANMTAPPNPQYEMTIVDVPRTTIARAIINVTSKVKHARAKDCYAVGNNNKNNKLRLTDANGCSVHKRFSGWKWDKNNNTLVASFKRFSLKGDSTHIVCTVESCNSDSECTANCPQADSPRRKCEEKYH